MKSPDDPFLLDPLAVLVLDVLQATRCARVNLGRVSYSPGP